MDIYNGRIEENPNEDYTQKKFVEKPNYALIKFLSIPIILIILFVLGVNLFMFVHDFDSIISYSEEFGVDSAMVASIIHVESKYRQNEITDEYAYGYMQVTNDMYEFVSKEIDISEVDFDEITKSEFNILVGTYYYSYLYNEFDGNEINTLCAYEIGEDTVKSWLASPDYSLNGKDLYYIPNEETKIYFNSVQSIYPYYKAMIELRI